MPDILVAILASIALALVIAGWFCLSRLLKRKPRPAVVLKPVASAAEPAKPGDLDVAQFFDDGRVPHKLTANTAMAEAWQRAKSKPGAEKHLKRRHHKQRVSMNGINR